MFTSERKVPFSTEGFARMLQRAAKAAGLTIKVHPHMLRHACGFKLANDGRDTRAIQSYLGHKNIQHTVRYTELAPGRFQGILEGLKGGVSVTPALSGEYVTEAILARFAAIRRRVPSSIGSGQAATGAPCGNAQAKHRHAD